MDKFLRRKFIFIVWEVIYFTTHTQKKTKDENTENTQKQCVEEAQKETIRLIDVWPPQSIKSISLQGQDQMNLFLFTGKIWFQVKCF